MLVQYVTSDSDLVLPCSHAYGCKPTYSNLTQSLERLGRYVGRGNQRSIVRAAVDNLTLWPELVSAMCEAVEAEMKCVCSDSHRPTGPSPQSQTYNKATIYVICPIQLMHDAIHRQEASTGTKPTPLSSQLPEEFDVDMDISRVSEISPGYGLCTRIILKCSSSEVESLVSPSFSPITLSDIITYA